MRPIQQGDYQCIQFPLPSGERARVRGEASIQRRIFDGALFLVMSCLLFLCSPYLLWGQTELQYQSRGRWHEGIKPKPVSGYDIELISVLVDYQEALEKFPTQLKVQFYLEQKATVNVIVRELDYEYYYWLDKVKPQTPWAPGFRNVFEWSTDTVLQQLGKSLAVYDLGVLARLGKSTPSANEHVSPVILYHSQLPTTISGYRFTLKTGGDARLFCKFYKDGDDEPIDTQVFRRKRGGRPFTINWDASQAAPGLYKLVITGFFLNSNEHIKRQSIQFYHQPSPQTG